MMFCAWMLRGNLSDFVKWEWEREASNNIVSYQFFKVVLLLDCAFVVTKK